MKTETATKFKETEIGPIPEEWKVFHLTELAYVVGGGTPKTTETSYWGGAIPWLSVVDFNDDARKVYLTEKTITDEGVKNSSTKILKKGSLVISARGTVGALTQLGVDMAFNQSCYGLVAKSISNDLLYYFVKNAMADIKNRTHGSVFDTITMKTLDDIKMGVPKDAGEQKQIAEILSSLDDKIELNRKINANLEALAGALFKRWFVDFEFPDENGKPYKSSGGRMVDSDLGEIPAGWSTEKIGKLNLAVTDYVANGSFSSLKQNVSRIYEYPEYALFIRNTDLKNNFFTKRYVDEKAYEYLRKTHLIGGEVIISNVADVGSVYRCPKFKLPMVLGNNVIMLNGEYLNGYLYLLFKSQPGQDLIDSITSGSAQLKFNKTDFRNLEVIKPGEGILKEFDAICNNIFLAGQATKDVVNDLVELRDSLLPRLMSGKIRVKHNGEDI